MAKLTELLFLAADEGAAPDHIGDMRITALAGYDDGTTRHVGMVFVDRAMFPLLRGFVDELAPQVIPSVTIYWGGVVVPGQRPPATVGKALALARKMNLLPSLA